MDKSNKKIVWKYVWHDSDFLSISGNNHPLLPLYTIDKEGWQPVSKDSEHYYKKAQDSKDYDSEYSYKRAKDSQDYYSEYYHKKVNDPQDYYSGIDYSEN